MGGCCKITSAKPGVAIIISVRKLRESRMRGQGGDRRKNLRQCLQILHFWQLDCRPQSRGQRGGLLRPSQRLSLSRPTRKGRQRDQSNRGQAAIAWSRQSGRQWSGCCGRRRLSPGLSRLHLFAIDGSREGGDGNGRGRDTLVSTPRPRGRLGGHAFTISRSDQKPPSATAPQPIHRARRFPRRAFPWPFCGLRL